VLSRALSIVMLSLLAAVVAPSAVVATTEPSDTTPPPTFNEFYPEERSLSDCLSSLPKPDCGSDARGGWRQLTILSVVVVALGFIAWRIVRTTRRRA
jgi:hypothetical protein